MTDYLNPITGEFPRHDGDIQLIQPDWTPEQLLPEPWVEVIWQDPPTTNETQIALVAPPAQVDGVWTRQWAIHTYTAEELAANKARQAEMQQRLNPQENN